MVFDAEAMASRGSSPLARGLPTTAPRPSPSTRIIPARAGFTGYPAWVRSRAPDHPRSRGVYRIGVVLRRWLRGSSPLARGLLEVVVTAPDLARIIPARAGFTATGSANSRTPGDHPRSRGVYTWPLVLWAKSCGSSPLARGLPPSRRGRDPEARIIPARAGFTLGPHRNPREPRDHPRSRGVYCEDLVHRFVRKGSSPLARGLLLGDVDDDKWPGIIPARAGFTEDGGVGGVSHGDHPRSRGVYSSKTWM